MHDNVTELIDPEQPNEEPRKFAFDFSYWSHDDYEEQDDGYLAPTHPHYADQKKVFDDLGRGVLDNAWNGFNSTLFAYGQTGSGKSYSIVGYGKNKGIVPLFCDEMFKGIEGKKESGDSSEFEVSFSMLEIYNEQVRDLLNSKSKSKKGLRVRQHPKKGFYVPVNSYKDIENRMEEGTRNRTVAATLMNATSSRAHTIVGVTFHQKGKNAAGQETTKSAIINLVDLAGSERADSTGATGDRLKEGAAINQSLSSLGNVIAALADKANGKNVRVPYRDSVLTKLLKNALGGNSKTIMIAAISPADINFDETLSTLRYADRAKQIKTSAVVNEDPTEKLIRELQEENAKLKAALENGEIPKDDDDEDEKAAEGISEEEIAKMKEQMEEELRARMVENDRRLEEMNQSWQEKLVLAQELYEEVNKAAISVKEAAKTSPHFWNLNVDSQLSAMIIHTINEGENIIGNGLGDTSPAIELKGLSILSEHAIVTSKDGQITVRACNNAKVLLNGETVTSKVILHHGDRVMFGSNHLYVFHHPLELEAAKANNIRLPTVTYEKAQEEIAAVAGFDMDTSEKSREQLLLREELIELLPMVEEANAISQELDRKVDFEIVILSPEARGLSKGRPEPFIKMTNLESKLDWLWPINRFTNRKFLMQEMYQNYIEGEDWTLPDERDPFTESASTDIFIGTTMVYLESLSYLIDMREHLTISDYKGTNMGKLRVELIPCDENGKEYDIDADIFVDSPSELLGKKVNFLINISHALGLPNKFLETWCKFKFYLDDLPITTEVIQNTRNPEYNFKKLVSYSAATQQLIDYLTTDYLIVEVWGRYKEPSKSQNRNAGIKTKDMVMSKVLTRGKSVKAMQPHATQGGMENFARMAKMTFAQNTMKKKLQRLENKMDLLKKFTSMATDMDLDTVMLSQLKSLLNTTNPSAVAANLQVEVPPKKIKKSESAVAGESTEGDGETATLDTQAVSRLPATSSPPPSALRTNGIIEQSLAEGDPQPKDQPETLPESVLVDDQAKTNDHAVKADDNHSDSQSKDQPEPSPESVPADDLTKTDDRPVQANDNHSYQSPKEDTTRETKVVQAQPQPPPPVELPPARVQQSACCIVL
ncbi:uncharacterized protein TRIADDRAFT_53800 [Trichoplax adhaerens]|uniref:Kinesin-like protein 6 n=1 Tax=Trichoplax adhaerens TaxID=10228 RepID=B3RQ73_TRIAD|nr:hypothetical protein TRIADDRAFT_53800 [Trichoplax adhaerens]EDV28301.1 hypothetical protein TRIADDRAFT_53800 [Trichoplax adhaerens]|eukprot:XP_002110135.1 hypothetical protein TRIADDRAFT_53800 [Trichoplax adhaerens]